MRAFHRALEEHDAEGGVGGRAARYRAKQRGSGCRDTPVWAWTSIWSRQTRVTSSTSFRFPDHPKFDFDVFYQRLGSRGFVIYPGKVSYADCFRIGTIGRIFPKDVRSLLEAVGEVLSEMGVGDQP